jgi:hypothetical protein
MLFQSCILFSYSEFYKMRHVHLIYKIHWIIQTDLLTLLWPNFSAANIHSCWYFWVITPEHRASINQWSHGFVHWVSADPPTGSLHTYLLPIFFLFLKCGFFLYTEALALLTSNSKKINAKLHICPLGDLLPNFVYITTWVTLINI